MDGRSERARTPGLVWLVGFAVLATALLSACGGGGDDSSSAPSTTTAAPCGGAAKVAAAVKTATISGLGSVADKFDVTDVRVAASDPTWARFSDVPKAGVVDFQGGYGIARCVNGAWTVTDAGSAEVGCPGGTIPGPPSAVRADLQLECP